VATTFQPVSEIVDIVKIWGRKKLLFSGLFEGWKTNSSFCSLLHYKTFDFLVKKQIKNKKYRSKEMAKIKNLEWP
jgi:hypothetical protein